MSAVTPEIRRACETLGLEPGSTPLEIRRAYRLRVKEWHPDRFGHDPALRRAAEEKMKAINAAYATLRALNPSFHRNARRERRKSQEDASQSGAAGAVSPAETVYCLWCRAPMAADTSACPACGADREAALEARRSAEVEERRRHRDERGEKRRSRMQRWLHPVADFMSDGWTVVLWGAYLLLRLIFGRW